MKKVSLIIVLFAALAACSTKPTVNNTIGSREASNNKRFPSNSEKFLEDKYGDAAVYFCSPDRAILYVDPNECGKNMLQGRPCNEAAPFISKRFEFQDGRGVIELGGRPWYEVVESRKGAVLTGRGLRNAIELNWVEMDSGNREDAEFYCGQ